MYEAFFSLEDSPFVLTPDPRFLLRSKGHHEILGTLLYGITSQKGLMALIGDVGTGKTTLCRTLLRELPKDVQSALVLNPHLSDTELVGTILEDLGVERRGATKGELMTVLSQHLLAAGGEGKTVVVILDEAQQMSVEALEQIRILSTLETATRKLLQIVLVGQPELEEKLKRRELRQLDQRIGIRCYLKPLSRKDTLRYIEHRLRIAGLPGALPFSRAAMARIYKFSRGIPRVINLVCDRALMAAYSARAREVNPAIVRRAIRNLVGETRRRRSLVRSGADLRKLWRPALAAAAVGVIALGGVAAAGYWGGRGGWSPLASPPTPVMKPSPAVSPSIVRPIEPRPSSGSVPAMTAPGPSVAGRIEAGVLPRDGGLKSLMLQALRLWGVNEDPAGVAAWPAAADGSPDLPEVAARYQLAATFLPATTLAEIRAIGLPAIVELRDRTVLRPFLVRRMAGDGAVLVTPTGAQVSLTLDAIEQAWGGQAWVVWRNVDQVPSDPNQELTPIVLATLAVRFQKLGHITPPLPAANTDRFQQGVRRFQRAMGLTEDGIVGPRTTLALSRVIAGRFSPSILEPAAPSR